MREMQAIPMQHTMFVNSFKHIKVLPENVFFAGVIIEVKFHISYGGKLANSNLQINQLL